MIAPLGRHLRKWLLGLAVAARNRVQVIVARLASAEEKKTADAGPEVTPQGAKTVSPAGPPDHWVKLVKRHAPELLQAGSPYTVPRTRSPSFERDAGMGESASEASHDLKSDSEALDDEDALTQGDLPQSSSSPRAPKEYEDPVRKRQTPDQSDQRQTGDDFRISGAAATSPAHTREEAATRAPVASRSGSAGTGRPSLSPEEADSRFQRRTTGWKRNKESDPAAGQGTGFHKTESAVAARRSQPPNGQIKNARADATDRENPLTTEPSGRHGEQDYPKALGHEAGFRVDTRMPLHREIKQEAGYDTQPVAGGASDGLGSAQDTGGKISASQLPGHGDDFRPVNEDRINNGRRATYALEDKEIVAEKISAPLELCWPSLPGENDSEDIRDPHLTATWPVLPEDRPVEVKSPSTQLEPHPTEAESRNIERLRRLDEEQKGRPWSESHF